MDLAAYRASPTEQARIASLLELMPKRISSGLDIGARDGYIAVRMADRANRVIALDLSKPEINHEKITCIQGNASALDFDNNSFEVAVCAEVLEHIPSPFLEQACKEIVRVTRQWAIIGVPFEQDIRFGATRCPKCGATNPPWGHVNSFTLEKLANLFHPLNIRRVEYVGVTQDRTNSLAHALMSFAGHPYGTYGQEECCVFCGAEIQYIDKRTLMQRLATRVGHTLNKAQTSITPKRGMWVHILFEKGDPG